VNRLAREKSAYLRQHGKDPVDWYPWGSEAFEAAAQIDKPIFLSIGYATCHWCHVMGRESFSDPEIGALMNDNFISIKVDREERPDIDNIYMEMAQALMSSPGGWPLNLILTPDLKPFFAATYLPKELLKEVIVQMKELWVGEERGVIIQESTRLIELFDHTSNATGTTLPSNNDITRAVSQIMNLADPIHGGLQGEPKFPLSYHTQFLMSHAKKTSDSRALFFTELTLTSMRKGGIFDQIGGGFSRYCVDVAWVVPHFEKMLYDNALLAKTYIEAFRLTKDVEYAETASATLRYLIRDMGHVGGGFYGAEDADSEGHEGIFYTWTPDEVAKFIPGEEGELFCSYFDITHQGNFEGRSILHIEADVAEFCSSLNIDETDFSSVVLDGCKKLFNERQKRERPLRDEKVVVSWNGLVIDALIHAGKALSIKEFETAAIQAAEFIRNTLWKEGRLYHLWCEGPSNIGAFLDDYACLIKGVLSLYEAGCGKTWLEWAIDLTKAVERDFKEIEGAFYQTDGREPLILRKCEFADGSEPSGNAVHTENLIRLYKITGIELYLTQAEDVLKAAKKYIDMAVPSTCFHLMALQRYLDLDAPIVKMGQKPHDDVVKTLFTIFSPHMTIIWDEAGDGSVTICEGKKCRPPLTKLDEIINTLKQL
jgi:hypothetical protein